jgi:diadenosine tetraphosphate (Ap4A) HIT family hydrolase
MPEPASEIHARALAAAESDGHLPAASMSSWEIFPWTVVDGVIRPKVLEAPGVEAPRIGDEGGRPCTTCAGVPPERIVWEDEDWILTREEKPTGLPMVLVLHSRVHLDAGEFDDDQASTFGRICNRLVRIIQGLDHIGRVHVNRWGDGSSHFHVWFFARPAGFEQIKGSYAVEWDDILPPGDEETLAADLHVVATKLANWGGHARA